MQLKCRTTLLDKLTWVNGIKEKAKNNSKVKLTKPLWKGYEDSLWYTADCWKQAECFRGLEMVWSIQALSESLEKKDLMGWKRLFVHPSAEKSEECQTISQAWSLRRWHLKLFWSSGVKMNVTSLLLIQMDHMCCLQNSQLRCAKYNFPHQLK